MSDSPSANTTAHADSGSVRVPRDLSRVGPAVDELRAWLLARGAPSPKALDEVALAATEALSNAVRHGGAGIENFTVELAWIWRDSLLEIEVSEPGRFEPPEDWNRLPKDPLSEGGRGGFLITELMDEAEHRNANGRHTLWIRRRLERRPDR